MKHKPFGLIIISQKEYNAVMNQSFTSGYDLGYRAGREDAAFSKFTPNEIRAAFGFEPMKNTEVKCNYV